MAKILWGIRLSLVIFILIPGTVPAMIAFTLHMFLKWLDPEGVVIDFLSNAYQGFLQVLPEWIQPFVVPIVIVKFVLIYFLVLKMLHPKEKIVEVLRRKVITTYEKYVKMPTAA